MKNISEEGGRVMKTSTSSSDYVDIKGIRIAAQGYGYEPNLFDLLSNFD